MGTNEAASVDVLTGRVRNVDRLIAPRLELWRASWFKPLVSMWVVATAVVLYSSIGETAAYLQFPGQPKTILFLHSFGQNFQQGAAWTREIQNELNRRSPWPLDIQEQSLLSARNGD